MKTTKRTIVTFAVLAVLIPVSLFVMAQMGVGDVATGERQYRSNHVALHAAQVNDSRLRVTFHVTSNIHGTVESNANPAGDMYPRRFFKDYYLEPGEVLHISLDVSVDYNGSMNVITCAVYTPRETISEDRFVKRKAHRHPDVRCGGTVANA